VISASEGSIETRGNRACSAVALMEKLGITRELVKKL
jgi:hypothetical protein